VADVLSADPDALEGMGRELRGAAGELEQHAARFRAQCGRSGGAYGDLPQSQTASQQHLASVTTMSDHLDDRVNRLHSYADYLHTVARTYRDRQQSSLESISSHANGAGG
jgi:ABC-type transporter Mla subunit MlaD